MTDDEIRIAIAESVCWQWWQFKDGKGVEFHQIVGPNETNWQWRHKGIKCERPLATWMSHAGDVPAYTEDLNAMAEVEKILRQWAGDPSKYGRYVGWLSMITHGSAFPQDSREHAKLISATARQRAEAYLRTIGKWKE